MFENTSPQNRIRILYTSDVHGKICPYSYADGSQAMHGFARLKTLIGSLRDENTILLDNGDVLEGSPLTFYHYRNHKDAVCPVTRAMKSIGYDYINIGNHDFNFGLNALDVHIRGTGAVCLTSNVIVNGTPLSEAYVVREIAGKRIAFFGVTTQHVPHWEAPENILGVTFPDAFSTAWDTVNLIRKTQAADYIVCLYHGGLECDPETGEETETLTGENEGYKMLKEIDGLDVLLLGHQHREYCGTLFDTVYTQPGADGRFLACIDIDAGTGAIDARLIPADAEPDEAILRDVRPTEDAVQKWLDTPLGRTKVDLRIMDEFDARLHKSQVATFLNRVQMDATGAELSASAIFLHATGFEEEITMRQLVATYVFPNTLVVKRVTGKTLREFLERAARFWDVKNGELIVSASHDYPTPQHYNYDMVDGIDYTIKAGNPEGERIVALSKNGITIEDADVFTMAVNNYRAAGGGEYGMIAEAETVLEIQTSMVDLIADYIMKHPVIEFTPVHNIKVIP